MVYILFLKCTTYLRMKIADCKDAYGVRNKILHPEVVHRCPRCRLLRVKSPLVLPFRPTGFFVGMVVRGEGYVSVTDR